MQKAKLSVICFLYIEISSSRWEIGNSCRSKVVTWNCFENSYWENVVGILKGFLSLFSIYVESVYLKVRKLFPSSSQNVSLHSLWWLQVWPYNMWTLDFFNCKTFNCWFLFENVNDSRIQKRKLRDSYIYLLW